MGIFHQNNFFLCTTCIKLKNITDKTTTLTKIIGKFGEKYVCFFLFEKIYFSHDCCQCMHSGSRITYKNKYLAKYGIEKDTLRLYPYWPPHTHLRGSLYFLVVSVFIKYTGWTKKRYPIEV